MGLPLVHRGWSVLGIEFRNHVLPNYSSCLETVFPNTQIRPKRKNFPNSDPNINTLNISSVTIQ